MFKHIFLFVALIALSLSSQANAGPMDTLGITAGSVHMKGEFEYTQFVKKHKGDNQLVIHIWYNPTSSTKTAKEVKAGPDEIYFLYGRNLRKGASEMEFELGENVQKAFKKKKENELTELVDFFQFDVFPGQHFNGDKAMEALLEAFSER